jgi:ribosomal protein L7/L12
MATKVEEIIEQLKSLTLLEAADLVKQIETRSMLVLPLLWELSL